MTGNRMGEDLMTRRQVASLFRVTSAAVASWARRGRLPEVRNEAGRPRYRRADVEALFRSGVAAEDAMTGPSAPYGIPDRRSTVLNR